MDYRFSPRLYRPGGPGDGMVGIDEALQSPDGSYNGQGMHKLSAGASAVRKLLLPVRAAAGHSRPTGVGGTAAARLEPEGHLAVSVFRAAGLPVPELSALVNPGGSSTPSALGGSETGRCRQPLISLCCDLWPPRNANGRFLRAASVSVCSMVTAGSDNPGGPTIRINRLLA